MVGAAVTASKLLCCKHIDPAKITQVEIDALKKRNLFQHEGKQVVVCDPCAHKIRNNDADDGLLENIASVAIGVGLGIAAGSLLSGLFGDDISSNDDDDDDSFSGGGGDFGGGGSEDSF